ncbi:cytochrome c oxidase subunit II [Halorussus sp. MSC15.2]|uniref:cytochrome c oxidase subunit II n=1 Tax=Halorussus sp. MSC15.2 TaxID=2283638 RepID=UPI0013D35788|nr:cytochrome c oxidase subunit II [Halorussus sp. MSC15.2]NEU58053.1 cytochrome c oxidase subunit II [Halorussus sp. MSC15.2]
MVSSAGALLLAASEFLPAQSGIVPKGTRVEVFQRIFTVFLVLGTLVGVVVIGYMVYNAYKYRDGDGRATEDEGPRLGELPTGGGGGRKLFFSFGLSTIIVVSLIAWTYGTLLYVEENPPGEGEEGLEIDVVGYRFGWDFVYPNGHTSSTLRVPENETVHLRVTSEDVFHTFGVPELRVKTDAIPGQRTDTWFRTNETGTYEARCFELCGAGHSYMTADVVVMDAEAYESWYANTTSANGSASNSSALLGPGDAVAPGDGATSLANANALEVGA